MHQARARSINYLSICRSLLDGQKFQWKGDILLELGGHWSSYVIGKAHGSDQSFYFNDNYQIKYRIILADFKRMFK